MSRVKRKIVLFKKSNNSSLARWYKLETIRSGSKLFEAFQSHSQADGKKLSDAATKKLLLLTSESFRFLKTVTSSYKVLQDER